ncbi:MAG: hypothetical protein JST67_03425 [Bacteroidetes bacterium]|nr:hypothetical protein [Bacteroidota bacterium]
MKKKINAPLFKYLALLISLLATASFLLFASPSGKALLMLQIAMGVLYLFFSVAEFSNALTKMTLPYDRFFYMPYSLVSRKLIWLGALSIASAMLWVSSSGFVFLALFLTIIIGADILVFALKVKQKVFYVSLFANYILFSLEQEQKIFASTIDKIEYRYDIFYLNLKDKKTISIITDRLNENQKHIFIEKCTQWILRNKITLTAEAAEKLKEYASFQ